MKTLSSYTVPKWAHKLTELGKGNSPQLVVNSIPIIPWATSVRLWLRALLGSLLILVGCSSAFAADGDLDTTFNATGKVTTAIGSSDDYGHAVAIQSDGKIIVAGYSSNGSNNDVAVVRYLSNGTLDTTFGTGGKVTTAIGSSNDYSSAVAIQSDGKIIVAGGSSNGSNDDFAVVRYLSNGTLDTTFGTGGTVTTVIGSSTDSVSAVAIQSDGKIIVAGRSSNGSNDDFAVVRYLSNGTLDTTFGTGGKVTTAIGSGDDLGYAVAIQSDGKIIVAGYSYDIYSDVAVVRYLSDGTLDTNFNTTGKVTTSISSRDDYVYAVAIQSDGKILVAGSSDAVLRFDFAVVRYLSNGTLDTTFGTGGKVTTTIGSANDYSYAYAVAIQSDGKILVAGGSNNGSNYDVAVVRYLSNGTLDTTFGTGGKVTTAIGSGDDLGYAVAIQSDGKILVAGYSSNGSDSDFAVVRYLANTPPVATDGTLTTNEDTAGSGTLSASDAEANPLTYSLVANGSKGTATITNASTGAYTYTPTLNQNGTDTFTFKVNDGTVDSNTATITVTITAINDSPTLTSFSAPLDITAEDTEVELTFAELTTQGDESDSADAINSGTVTSLMVQAISTGTLKIGTTAGTATAYAAGSNETIDATLNAYWTPALDVSGTLEAFTVKAKDDSGALSSTAVPVQVTVTPAPLPVTPPPSPPPEPVTSTPISVPPLPPMTLTLSFSGAGTGSLTSKSLGIDCSPTSSVCSHTVTSPTWVTLTTTPGDGSIFSGLSGDPACQAEGKVFILADTACVATFELQSYELSVGRFGQGKVTGPGLDCPPDCTETFIYGTEVQLEAVADREWIHTGWKGRCDPTGKVRITNAHLCQAVFEPDLGGPNLGDGNGDGVVDALQPNVISLPDKVSGNYITFAVQPETCAISDLYTDLPDNYGQPVKNKPMPQGLIYFDLACPQAQISLYYHAVKVVKRNFIFRKYGPLVPGDENTLSWYLLPNVTFEAVIVGGNPVVKASYTLKDGELGDSTGVDGRIVDPGGIVVK